MVLKNVLYKDSSDKILKDRKNFFPICPTTSFVHILYFQISKKVLLSENTLYKILCESW